MLHNGTHFDLTKLTVYTDGAGGTKSGWGCYVKETQEAVYKQLDGLTNNQAEYLAIIAALKRFENSEDDITLYSDSRNTVNQLNHEFAINNGALRELAKTAWALLANIPNIKIFWVPRAENLAGKMLGS